MTTKQRLALVWNQLSAVAKNLSTLTAHELELQIIEMEQGLAEARRLIHIGGFTPVYAVGIEHEPGSYGMTHGPTPDLKEMLSVIPFGEDTEKYCLFRFEGEKQILTHRWATELKRWAIEA